MDGMSKQENSVYKKGERIGQYEVVEALEQTRFVHIYLAQHMYQRTQMLIEVFQPPLQDDLREQFLTQARALMMLEHPNILRLRDVGVQHHYPFVAADYIAYRSFKQVYPQGTTQPLANFLPHLKKIVSALSYAYSQHILHGDIRPENILLSGSNNLLLWGFLVEAITKNRERLNYQQGGIATESLPYASPEQVQGRGNLTPAVDQYALAMVVYELLCGSVPFTGSPNEVAYQQMHATVPPLRQKVAGIPVGVERAVMRALEKDPSKRFGDVQAFIQALEQDQVRPLAAPWTPAQQGGPISTPGFTPAPSFQAAPPQNAPSFQAAPPQNVPAFQAAPPQNVPAFQAAQQAGGPVSTPGFATPAPSFQPATLVPQLGQTANAPVEPELVNEPMAPRRDQGTTVSRRVFAVGLVGLAAIGGAGGWYLLSQRLSKSTVSSSIVGTTPVATRTTGPTNTGVLIFTGHLASVNALAWSPDGTLIASAGDDNFVQVWDSTSGQRKFIYTGHTEEVASVAWAPNGELVASGGQDGTVQVWSSANGGRSLTYRGHKDRVNGLSWRKNSQQIASGSDDKTVQIWNAVGGEVVFNFVGHTNGVLCVGWQPNNTSVASGSWDGTLRDWATVAHGNHFAAGEQIFSYGGHGKNEVTALAWSPDSRFIASAGADQTVQFSNSVNGGAVPPPFTGHRSTQHVNPVLAVSWSPDGSSLASGDTDGNIFVWKAASRQSFFTFRGHKGAVNALSWSPDGKKIASAGADNTVQVWQPS